MLRTILPLSPELDSILRMIFECNPQKRITIPELRFRIMSCRRFTTGPGPMDSPPLSEVSDSSDLVEPDVFHLASTPYRSQAPGVFTPDSTPSTTPQTTQTSRQNPYMLSKHLTNPPSESSSKSQHHHDASNSPSGNASPIIVPVTPSDFPPPPGQSLWQLPIFPSIDDVERVQSPVIPVSKSVKVF